MSWDAETTQPDRDEPRRVRTRALVLTIAAHPDPRRIGELARLGASHEGWVRELSRGRPSFHRPGGAPTGPLVDPHVSRAPLTLLSDGTGGVLVRRPPTGPAIRVDGRHLADARALAAAELEAGVVLELGGHVVLVLHAHDEAGERPPAFGLVGESAALQRVRVEILHVAPLALPVLLRGESGTGKEIVARALHAASPRAARPCVSVNIAALNPQTAVAELFGHTSGAFTGATRARDGYFRAADGGTLFLDEIGEAPLEVQVSLLRAIESGEIQPVGGSPAPVDVRLIAATDANLEDAVLRGGFRLSLLHRLAGCEIWLPPLRRRRDDIPRLLAHFVHAEVDRAGPPAVTGVARDTALARLPGRDLARLVRHDWPGNVRQLANVARQLAAFILAGRDLADCVPLARALAAVAVEPAPSPVPAVQRPASARPGGGDIERISDAALIAALKHHHWVIDATARYLGISRTSLYARIERCPQLSTARELPRDVLLAAFQRCGGDLARMSDELRVSQRGLQLRLRELRRGG
jgi:two-component system nitrogen regulation response regulator GlnG